MANVLLTRRRFVHSTGIRIVERNYDTDDRSIKETEFIIPQSQSFNYPNYSKPAGERVHAYVGDIFNNGPTGEYGFHEVYHDGNGGVTFTVSPPVSGELTITNALCKGAATGSVLVSNLQHGSGQYRFLWNDFATGQNRINIPAGDYWLDISDAAEPLNTFRYHASVAEPATAITVGGTVTNTVCFGSANGSISVTVSGGTPGPAGGEYTFQWNDGVTTRDRSGLRAGAYQLTVTDANGCVRSRNFTVFENPEIIVTATIDESDVTLQVTGGKPGYSFRWSDGATTRDRAGLTAGSYQVTVTDSAGCRKTVSVSVSKFQFWFSRNFIPLRLQATEPETKPNLSFLCEVWLEETYRSGNYRMIYDMELPADRENAATFDAQPILDAYLAPFLPEGSENKVSQARSLFRRFYLKYSEKSGTPPLPGPYSQADISTVVLGGLSFEEYAAKTFFSSYLKNQKPFLTWEPAGKEVFADQPEYLYYLTDEFSSGAFRAVVNIRYQDGGEGSHVFHTQSGVNLFEVYCLPAGYTQLQLELYQPGRTVAGWEVFINNGAGARVSETRTYRIRTDYAPTGGISCT